jgi:hypothetical protein
MHSATTHVNMQNVARGMTLLQKHGEFTAKFPAIELIAIAV